MSSTGTTASRTLGDRLLGGVEKWGNRLPDPLILFTGLFLIVAVLSTVFGALGTTVTVPGSEEGPVTVKPFFSGEGCPGSPPRWGRTTSASRRWSTCCPSSWRWAWPRDPVCSAPPSG